VKHLPDWHRARTLFDMPSVAVIGASSDRSKWGNKAVRAFQQRGFTVYPVNPSEPTVEGLTTYKTIADVPARPEMITVYVRPQILLKLLPDIAAKGCDELWLNPGTESDAVLAETERLNLNVVQACSIIGVGVSPGTL
jgi:predicted CoA-binding protein